MSALTARDLGVSADLYPWAGQRIDVDGHQLHYLDEGPRQAAQTLLMVHGNPTWSFYWRDLVKAFSPSARCIVPDHIGMGLSDKPGDDGYEYTLKRRIDDLDALMAKVAPSGPVTLIAHDWGGMIGMGWACRNPSRIERIVLLNTSAFAPSAEIKLPWQLKLARSPLGTALVQGGNAFAIGATWTCTVKSMSSEVKHGFTAPYRSFNERISTLRFVQDIPLSPADQAWATVEAIDAGLSQFAQTPILIQWGMKDFVFHAGFLRQFRKRWPHAEVDEYRAGHYVLEDETDAIVERARGFIGL